MSLTKQIAADCGVSLATVGHILGNKRQMHSAETCKRVLAHAAKLGYRPNSSAKAIGSGRFNCATLLLSTNANKSNLPDLKLSGIHDAFDDHDYHLNVARMTDERLAFDISLPKFLRQWMTDGILVNYTMDIPERILEGIHADRAPAIWINSKQGSDCVYSDDRQAGFDATMHLLELGHQRIVYAELGGTHYSVTDRCAGYCDAMRQAGLTPRTESRFLSVADWVADARSWFDAPDQPTAVLAYSEYPGLAIAYAAELAGLRVPEDLSLIVFDNMPLEDRTIGRRVTTWLVPEYEVGKAAAEMLLKKIDAPAQEFSPIIVPFTISEDLSCSRRR